MVSLSFSYAGINRIRFKGTVTWQMPGKISDPYQIAPKEGGEKKSKRFVLSKGNLRQISESAAPPKEPSAIPVWRRFVGRRSIFLPGHRCGITLGDNIASLRCGPITSISQLPALAAEFCLETSALDSPAVVQALPSSSPCRSERASESFCVALGRAFS